MAFEGLHDSAGSLWDIELLGVVTGAVSPRIAPRGGALDPCLALVVHATFRGPAPFGTAAGLSLGSAEGGGRAGACLADELGLQDEWETITPGTSVIATFGMIEFEGELPTSVEIFVRDASMDTTDYLTIAVGDLAELPPTTVGPPLATLEPADTPITHAAPDGSVTATVVGLWPETVEGGTCWRAAATFAVSEQVHRVTVEALDWPSAVADGRLVAPTICGGPIEGFELDPSVTFCEPGTVYGMSWAYLVTSDSAPDALVVPPLASPTLIEVLLLQGPPASP